MSKATDREEFLVVLMANNPGEPYTRVLNFGYHFMRLARKYHRLQMKNGDVGLTQKEKQQEENLVKRIAKDVKEFNPAIKVKAGGDYRATTVRLILPGGQHNCIDDSWGVPV